MTDRRPWWERHREVLQEEEAALEDLADDGTPVTLDGQLLEAAQVRRYTLRHTCGDKTLDLAVTFSDWHPYFRPDVVAEQRLGTHQQPFDGTLCLFEGDTWHWDPSQTVGEMLAEQLPRLLAEQPDGATPLGRGAHVEPFVGYYDHKIETAVRVGETTDALADSDGGTFDVVLDRTDIPDVLRATMTAVRDAAGNVLWELDPQLRPEPGPARPLLGGPWVRLEQRPDGPSAADVYRAILATDPGVERIVREHDAGDGATVAVGAAVFEDSIRPHELGDAWLFVYEGHGPKPKQPKSHGRTTPKVVRPHFGPYLARAYRTDRRTVAERTPSLAPMAEAHVVQFGVGGIGAPLATDLARALVGRLTLVDYDTVQPGNTPRWELGGILHAGLVKAPTLAHHLTANYPHTKVAASVGKLGGRRGPDNLQPEWDAVHDLLEGADLVVDATAEIGVTHFLSDLTRELGVPLLVASATEGGWGGRIALFGTAPDDPCWSCIRHHTADGTLPVPPSDPEPATGHVHPAGCPDTTFTGTGFDVAAISNAAARLVAATLCGPTNGGYPPADWNVAIYRFRDTDNAYPGHAETFTVSRHPECGSCQARRSG